MSSQASRPGEVFHAEVAQDVVVGGRAALPAGARVTGTVTEAQALRKIGGRARLANHRRPNAAFVSGFNQATRMGIAAGSVQQVNMATMITVKP